MADKILNSFNLWIGAQGWKSKLRLKSVDNISLEGIARLRELILDLAVKGKLISQNTLDEPASVLVKTIAQEKRRLIEKGEIKNDKPLPKIEERDKPFELPKGWEFVRLGEITNKIGSGSTPRGGKESYSNDGVLFLRSQNIWNYGLELSDVAFITPETHETMSNTKVFPNDILLNITGGSLGRSTIFPAHLAEANVSQHVTIIRPTAPDVISYLHLCIISPYVQGLIWGRQVGANREGLSKKVLELFEIALPPLAEQHRIVAKVDELMALCDKLEQQETNHLKSHQLLVETLLGTLTQARDAAEFQTAWATLAQHFDDLFTTEDSIDQLKQTILQLAVMGKLVKQDPKDEPASVLLERIKKEKERLVEEGKIKRQKPLPEIKDEEKLFTLPDKWVWSKLCDLGFLLGGFAYQSSDFKSNGDHQVIRMGNIRPDFLRLEESPAFIPDKLATQTTEYKVLTNDVLVTMTGTKGKRDYLYTLVITTKHLNQRELYLNQRLCIIRPLGISSSYINLVTKDNRLLDSMYAQSTGTANQANIGMGTLNNWVIPIPPLDEQRRIISKVDELFTLCDGLKERIGETQKVVNLMAEGVVP